MKIHSTIRDNLLKSEKYQEILQKICIKIGSHFDIEIPEVLFQRDEKLIQAADISSEDYFLLLNESKEKFVEFSIKKFNELKESDDDGELPDSELQLNDQKSSVVEYHPMFSNFLISYMIEYILATKYPDKLEPYLKSMRYPFAKKYAKQLKIWILE